jgi:hypothetical protein
MRPGRRANPISTSTLSTFVFMRHRHLAIASRRASTWDMSHCGRAVMAMALHLVASSCLLVYSLSYIEAFTLNVSSRAIFLQNSKIWHGAAMICSFHQRFSTIYTLPFHVKTIVPPQPFWTYMCCNASYSILDKTWLTFAIWPMVYPIYIWKRGF